ncbi:MAG: hypothetical protein ACREEE_02630, partial [Dongiaceae bacterium]
MANKPFTRIKASIMRISTAIDAQEPALSLQDVGLDRRNTDKSARSTRLHTKVFCRPQQGLMHGHPAQDQRTADDRGPANQSDCQQQAIALYDRKSQNNDRNRKWHVREWNWQGRQQEQRKNQTEGADHAFGGFLGQEPVSWPQDSFELFKKWQESIGDG